MRCSAVSRTVGPNRLNFNCHAGLAFLATLTSHGTFMNCASLFSASVQLYMRMWVSTILPQRRQTCTVINKTTISISSPSEPYYLPISSNNIAMIPSSPVLANYSPDPYLFLKFISTSLHISSACVYLYLHLLHLQGSGMKLCSGCR